MGNFFSELKRRHIRAAPRALSPDIAAQFQQAQSFHGQGKLEEAEGLYRAVLSEAPQHFDALHMLGLVAFQKEQPAAALELIERAIAINPKLESAHFNRALLLQDLGRTQEALAVYDRVIELKPDCAEAFSNRGNALFELKRLDEALKSYDRAIELKPDYAEPLNNRGTLLLNLKCPDEALASYDRAIELKTDYAEAFYNRGNALLDLEHLDDALASYDRALQLRPDYVEALYNRGNLLLELKRLNEGLASYDRVIELKPDHAEAFNNRGNALSDLKRRDEAIESFDHAMQLKPDYAQAFSNRGNALLDLGRTVEALANYDRAIELEPGYAEAFFNRGTALRRLKRPDEALASYDRALQIRPDYVEAISNRGNALLDLERPAEAVASYDRAIELKPDDAEAFSNCGNAFIKLRAWNQALESLDRALQLNSDFPEAHYNRGLVLRHLKRLNEAYESFARALQLKPDFAPAGYTRGTIEVLRDRYREGPVNGAWRSGAEESDTKRRKLSKINAPIWLGENLTGCKSRSARESNQNAQIIGNGGSRSNPDRTLMQFHVVNMRRRKDRREQFLAWNYRKGRFFSFFDAVEGSQDLRLNLIAQGLLMDPANLFTLGSLGCAMSHRTLWNQCVSIGKNYLIVEDDACLRSDFSEMLPPVIGAAGDGWDIIYLGYNTDATIAVTCEDGSISPIAFNDSVKAQSDFFDQYSKYACAEELPLVARCCQIWGTLAYMVSPVGAAKLCQSSFPLNSDNVIEMLGEGRSIWASGVDGMVNLALRRNIRAFCCIPPLVLGPNDQSDSDTVISPP